MSEQPIDPAQGATPQQTAAVDDEALAPDLEDDGVPEADDLPDDRFSNREMSWLDFNARVLAQAEDRRIPLLERLKFLAIFASNLDEFYMVRVAGLKRRLDMGVAVRSPDGRTARETLALLAGRTQELVQQHARVWLDDVEPGLEEGGIRLLRWADLDAAERERLRDYFQAQVFPVLTPLAVDPAHPFPYISGLSLNLAVLVRDAEDSSGVERFARVKVPNNVARFVEVKDERADAAYLPMEQLIAAHLDSLFPGLEVVENHVFRVTRNTDIEVEEDRDEDLLQALERELTRRRFGPAVRLEVTDTITPRVLELLV
jgi:polyphosphate kinase